MGLLDNIKIGLDTPRWLQMKPTAIINAAGTVLCGDKRNDKFRDNSIYHIPATNLYRYSNWYNGSMPLGAHGLTVAAGCWAGFVPSFGIVGTLAAGCSTTKLVTATATTAGTAITALGTNQLIRTDMDEAYEIRVVGLASGLTEERTLIANTSGLTPTFYLDTPLSFTPAAGDLFEVQSGILYMLGISAAAAGQSRYYGVAQGVFGNAGSTGITTATATSGVVLDEKFVPYDMTSGEGFLVGTATYNGGDYHCLQATNTAAGTITGQILGGDINVLQNEYRNFQIRIVEDTGTPAAVGQRRMIASHTAGTLATSTAPIYTLGSNWATTPSATAKYVIEYPNVIIVQNTTQVQMLTYNYSQATINNGSTTINANTWSSTYFDATASPHAAVIAAGSMAFEAGFHQPVRQTDGVKLSRHSHVWFFRGNSATLDLFDIAGAADGAWTNGVTYNNPVSFTTGSCGDIDSVTFLGEYAYIVAGATAVMYQFNVASPSLVPWTQLPLQSGTAAASDRVVCLAYVPAEPIAPSTTIAVEDKIGMIYVQGHLSTNFYRSDIIG